VRDRRPEFYAHAASIVWGILWLIVIAVIFSGCTKTLSTRHASAIGSKVAEVAILASLPVANIRFTEDGTFGGTYAEDKAAEADCSTWGITFNYMFAVKRPQFVIDKVVPHEFAHLASCWTRGRGAKGQLSIGVDPHDEIWRNWVIRLGGDPNYV